MNLKELFLWWIDFSPKQESAGNAKPKKVQFLGFDTDLFYQNLHATQKYCQLQQTTAEKDLARIYRSINPLIDGKPLFSFKEAHVDYDIEPGIRSCTHTEWSVDHWEPESMMQTLFEQQLEIKRKGQVKKEEEIIDGDIFVSMFDKAIPDGVSEIHSLGLIDGNDMPPIDTWFYMLKTEEHGRILFSWIPKEEGYYANEAILVNMLGCINWFKEEYPDMYKAIVK